VCVQGSKFRVQGLGVGAFIGSRFRVWGSGIVFGVWGLEFRVQGSGFRV
jgi:hypothetical protein